MRTSKLIAAWVLAACIPMWAQAGSGAKYGSRNPKTCPAVKSAGAPSAALASQLFACATEQDTGDTLILVENVQIQVASTPRHFQLGDLYNDIDQNSPVYPIRGSFVEYSCRKQFNLDASHTNVGKNCLVMQQPHSQGICYKNGFAEWVCRMRDPSVHWDTAVANMAPPK